MEELDDKAYNKPITLKGIDTVKGLKDADKLDVDLNLQVPKTNGGGDDPPKKKGSLRPELPKYFEYREPTTSGEALIQQVGSRTGRSTIKGDPGFYDYDLMVTNTVPMNIEQFIPDPNQREKFIEENGSKLVLLRSPTYFGIKFQKDLTDAIRYKQTGGELQKRRFLDSLSESQHWTEKLALTAANLIGGTIIHGTGLLPILYGIGSGLINWDNSKIFDNAALDLWDSWSTNLNKFTTVYANSDVYDYDKTTGHFNKKDFLARIVNDPWAGVANDVAPAVTFVTGMVVSELAAGALAPVTGGTTLVGNTARITAQGLRYFNDAIKGNKIFNRSYKALRKIGNSADDLKTFSKTARVLRNQKTIEKAINIPIRMVRSAAYESAIIAKSTTDRILSNYLIEYHKANGGQIDEFGNPIGDLIRPSTSELALLEKTAADAGKFAFFTNIPIVAGSNFFQFSKLFQRGYTASRRGANLGRNIFKDFKFGGTRIVNGKRVANVDADGLLKYLGYPSAFLKRGIVEGWEEFAQGAMEEGLVDYYTSMYSKPSSINYADIMSSIYDSAKTYMDTVEGRDSVVIGALMGLMGVRIPGIVIDKKTGRAKFGLGASAFGGGIQAIRDLNAAKKVARLRAENSLKSIENDTIRNNFRNTVRQMATQQNMEDAAMIGDVNEFKNQEHQQLFSLVNRHYNQGTTDVLLEDISDLENITLEEFNKLLNLDENNPFTEDQRKEAIKKAKTRVEGMIQSLEDIDNISEENQNKYSVESIAKRVRSYFIANKYLKDPDQPLTKEEINIAIGIKEQMAYLNSAVVNSQERMEALRQKIQDFSKNTFPIASLELIKATPKGARVETIDGEIEGKVEFTDDSKKIVDQVMLEWRTEKPIHYSQYSAKVGYIINDYIKLKIREARAAAMYRGMFTSEGARKFREIAIEIHKKGQEAFLEKIQENIEEKSEDPKSSKQASKIRKDAESLGSLGKKAIQNLDQKVIEGLNKFKSLDKNTLGTEKYEEEVLKILNENPSLFARAKEYIEEEYNQYIQAENIEDLENFDHDGSETSLLIKALKDLTDNFKSTVPKPTRNIFDNAELNDQLDLNNQESVEMAIDEDSQQFFRDLQVDTTDEENTIFINNSELKFEKGELVRDSETGEYVKNPVAEELKLDVNKLNSPTFLNNSIIKNKGVEFELRVSEESEFNVSEEVTPYNMVVEVFYTDPNTKEETKIGQLPSFNEGDKAALKVLREEVFRRFRKGLFFGKSESIDSYKKRKKEILSEIAKLQKQKRETKPVTETEKARFADNQVPVSRKTFTIKSPETTDTYTIKEYLDGSVEFEQLVDDKFVPYEAFTFNSLKDLKEVFEEKGDTVEVTKEEDYKTVMNLKMFDQLTADQQQRVDRVRYETAKTKEGLTEEEQILLEQYKESLEVETELINRGEGNLDVKKGLEEEIAKLESKISVEEEVESIAEINKTIKDLNTELKNLNAKIKGQATTFEYKQTTEIKDDGFALAFNKYTRAKTAKGKQSAREELINKYGEERVKRYESIDSNFKDIVNDILSSNINIFNDKEEGVKLQRCK